MKETEQTLLDQIKEDVAKDHEYSDFRQIFPDLQDFEHYSLIITEIAERYYQAKVKASCEATLIKASENAMVHYKGNLMCDPSDSSVLYHPDGSEFSINKQSIIDPSNIVIVL